MTTTEEIVSILDPSDKFRPEKPEEQFRNFSESCDLYNRVKKTYYTMHANQCYDFVKAKSDEWKKFNHAQMTIMEALQALNSLVDESDPDVDIPNAVHAFQTAERIREVHPDKPWFHLTGLIHDIGKMMAIWGEPQWCVVGDTFPVGCEFSEACVFGKESFAQNPDTTNPVYSQKLGIYKEHCGLENVLMSWGHDEYLYQVLYHNKCTLPDEAMYMIRYHSFYPWHTGGDYNYLCSNKDLEMKKWIQEFNKFDLYSKADSAPDAEALTPYYQSLIDKYCPGKLQW